MNEQPSMNWFQMGLVTLFLFFGMVWSGQAEEFTRSGAEKTLALSPIKKEMAVERLGQPAGKSYMDFDHCFDFSEFNYPEEMDYGLLSILCSFIETSGVKYVHRSDVRKSTHRTGDALDFHFEIPHGQDEAVYFYENFMALSYFIIGNQLFTMGIGLYHWGGTEWSIHLDTGFKGNNQLPLLRRWHVDSNGQQVAYGIGIDELRNQVRQRL